MFGQVIILKSSSVEVMLVGGVGESGGPSINHPTDLRR